MDIQLEKKRGLRPRHYLYLISIIALVFAFKEIVFGTYTPTYRIEKDRVSIAEVSLGEFKDYVSVNGIVAPISTIYMDAYEGGRVKEKLIEEGAMVHKGDIILKLENRALFEQILASENNLALKQNDLRSTKLNFDNREINGKRDLVAITYDNQRKKRNYKQNEMLFNKDVISREEYLRSKEDYELAQNQLDIIKKRVTQDGKLKQTSLKDLDADLVRMKKTLSMVYERIDYLNVRAPADGQLGFLDAEIGQNIRQGQRIGQLNVLTNFKIEAEVDEHYIDRIKQGLLATIERNDTIYHLKLRKVYPEVREGRFRVDLVFTSKKPKTIRAGQNYNLKVQLGASNEALLLPRGSFFQSTGGQSIFVLNETEKIAWKKTIKIGKQNSKYFELLEGLNRGEKVIISSYDTYGDAEKIEFK